MATITKRELVIKISNETGLTQQQVFDVIQRTLDSITDSLANGDTATNLAGAVQLDGLTFSGFDGITFGATTKAQ